jgi:hypothetical protein
MERSKKANGMLKYRLYVMYTLITLSSSRNVELLETITSNKTKVMETSRD